MIRWSDDGGGNVMTVTVVSYLTMIFIMDVLIHDDMGTCTSIYKQTKIVYVHTFHACVFLVQFGSGCG